MRLVCEMVASEPPFVFLENRLDKNYQVGRTIMV